MESDPKPVEQEVIGRNYPEVGYPAEIRNIVQERQTLESLLAAIGEER